MFHKKHKAFTLVELIVVITILAILGTIAFVSFQGFSQDARDSKRVNDIKTIEKGLSILRTKGNKLPPPDDYIQITASGVVISQQGKIGSGVLSSISQAGNMLDPSLNIPYTYSTNENNTEYQILSFMENSDSLISNTYLLNQTHAVEYLDLFPKTFGDSIGIVVDGITSEPKSDSDIELNSSTETYKIYFQDSIITTDNGQEVITRYTIERPEISFIDSSSLMYYDLNNIDKSTGIIPDKGNYGNDGTFGGNIDFSSGTHAEDNTNPRSAYIHSGVPMNFSTSDYTMLAMSYYDSSRPTGHFSIFSHGPGSPELMLIGKGTSNLNYRANGNSWVGGGGKSGYKNNEWMHMAFSIETNGETQMFHNGEGGQVVDIGVFPDVNIFFTAMNYGSSTLYAIDKIDEIRLYDRKLSDEEISVIYQNIKPQYN